MPAHQVRPITPGGVEEYAKADQIRRAGDEARSLGAGHVRLPMPGHRAAPVDTSALHKPLLHGGVRPRAAPPRPGSLARWKWPSPGLLPRPLRTLAPTADADHQPT